MRATLLRIINSYPNVDLIIYDRACKIVKEFSALPAFARIKTFAVDKMHGLRHNKRCLCSPWNHRRIMTRLRGLNTARPEQVFSWFRNYSTTLNSMESDHHRLRVLAYCRMHNELVDDGDLEHLNPIQPARPPSDSQPYACAPQKRVRRGVGVAVGAKRHRA